VSTIAEPLNTDQLADQLVQPVHTHGRRDTAATLLLLLLLLSVIRW